MIVIRYLYEKFDIKERLIKKSEIKGKTGSKFAEKFYQY